MTDTSKTSAGDGEREIKESNKGRIGAMRLDGVTDGLFGVRTLHVGGRLEGD